MPTTLDELLWAGLYSYTSDRRLFGPVHPSGVRSPSWPPTQPSTSPIRRPIQAVESSPQFLGGYSSCILQRFSAASGQYVSWLRIRSFVLDTPVNSTQCLSVASLAAYCPVSSSPVANLASPTYTEWSAGKTSAQSTRNQYERVNEACAKPERSVVACTVGDAIDPRR
jgi:hypothetical protein